jgi:glyoxylase-like metal-dependent hydrolase (beta-lactamase superfamily II)
MVALRDLDVSRHAISLLILTHEHHDHAGAADAFPEALVAAHPLTAAKLRHGDNEVTKLDVAHLPDLELSGGSAVHLGGFSFEVIHTPGHTSGSICLYERARSLLVTGDTAFAEGTLTSVYLSGSRGDHISTLERLTTLPTRLMLPGHGRISDDPRADLGAALEAARSGLPDSPVGSF